MVLCDRNLGVGPPTPYEVGDVALGYLIIVDTELKFVHRCVYFGQVCGRSCMYLGGIEISLVVMASIRGWDRKCYPGLRRTSMWDRKCYPGLRRTSEKIT